MTQSIHNDVLIHRFTALDLYKMFTREVTGTPASLALSDGGYVTLGLAATVEAQAHRLQYGAPAFRVVDLDYAKFRFACSADLPDDT